MVKSASFIVRGDKEDADVYVPKHQLDIIKIQKEAVIQVRKQSLIQALASSLEPHDEKELKILGNRIDAAIRAWYKKPFEDMVFLYRMFDPFYGDDFIQDESLTSEELENAESRFMRFVFFIMNKANYKMVTDREYEVAVDGTYLLTVPVKVDDSKLDTGFLGRFFSRHKVAKPSFADKYIIFRRGVGVHRSTDRFITQKIDMFLESIFQTILFLLSCGFKHRRSWAPIVHDLRENDDVKDENSLSIERIHLDKCYLSPSFFWSKTTIQEPTFERVILLYRPKVDPAHPELGERSVCIKHFRHIPMADMEIVLPEKKLPTLTLRDWISFSSTIVFGIAAVISAASASLSFAVVIAILGVFATYLYKLYYSWQKSMDTYRALLQSSMYDKQLDSGHATLLHLCDDVSNQEFKEVLVAYFILLTTGPAAKDDLDRRCEVFMEDKFGEDVEFDVEDAIFKLTHLKMIDLDQDGKYSAVPIHKATASIGETTDEIFGRTGWEPSVEGVASNTPTLTDPNDAV